MPLEKILTKLKEQITSVADQLDAFTKSSTQPGVEECAALQDELHHLLAQLAVYKHHKQNNELSPSFNLHAHISGVVDKPLPDKEPQTEEKQEPPRSRTETRRAPEHSQTQRQIRSLHIGLNDKFRFINELFMHNDSEYNIAIEQLSNLHSWSDSELYLNSLKNVYSWPDDQDSVKYFYSIVKKRFS